MSQNLYPCRTYKIEYGTPICATDANKVKKIIERLPSGYVEELGECGQYNMEVDRAEFLDYISELEEGEFRIKMLKFYNDCDYTNDTLYFHFF